MPDVVVFISYRRADTSADAGRLYDALRRRLGRENLFIDVDNIRPGQDWVDAVEVAVSRCDVLLALIGPDWGDALDDEGNRRLENDLDRVRLEIEAALNAGKSVIPVLFERARMPHASELPESLRPLLRRHAIRISHASFDSDLRGLLRALKTIEQRKEPAPTSTVAPSLAPSPELPPAAEPSPAEPPQTTAQPPTPYAPPTQAPTPEPTPELPLAAEPSPAEPPQTTAQPPAPYAAAPPPQTTAQPPSPYAASRGDPPPRPRGVTLASIYLIVMGSLMTLAGGACGLTSGAIESYTQVPGTTAVFAFIGVIMLVLGVVSIAAGAGALGGAAWARRTGVVVSIVLVALGALSSLTYLSTQWLWLLSVIIAVGYGFSAWSFKSASTYFSRR